jgi:hypothetical protein
MICLLAAAKGASAQYPTPTGGLFCSTSSVVVQQNSSFTFSATLVDITGVAVQGQVVSFTVQSSGGAYVSTSTGYTDWNGMASTTVYTGGATGTIVVYANSGGFTCQSVVTVPSVPNITCYITQISVNQYTFYIKLTSTSYSYASTYAFGGQTVLISVISGAGASLSASAVVTDGGGAASAVLYTIPTSGVVTVSANANGQACQASVTPPPPAAPAIYTAPPPSRPTYIAPPYTGDAGLAGNNGSASTLEYVAIIGLMVAASGLFGKLALARMNKGN